MTNLQERLYDLLQEKPHRSIRELQKLAGVSSTSVVAYNLDRLVALGYIYREKGQARAITLVGRCPCCGR